MKIDQQFYFDILYCEKRFEYRKDDRYINVGDFVTLHEVYDGRVTGHYVKVFVTYVLRDVPQYGLPDGYCVFGFSIVEVRNGT